MTTNPTTARNSFLRGLTILGALWAVSSTVAQGQTFTTLVNFNRTNGASPQFMSLVQGRDGNLWGAAARGGINSCGCGTIFKITPSGKLTIVYNLNPTSGSDPAAGLVMGADGNFYGVTAADGSFGNGTVFKITAGGTLTVLFNFDNAHGAAPAGALTQGTDTNFYGTTTLGGSGSVGTIFKITPGGILTTLQNFNSTNGAYPYGQLVQGTDGNFYGTTQNGGNLACSNGGCGTVLRVTPGGQFTLLHSFGGSDGEFPVGGLVQGADGDFYGTTEQGGTLGIGTVFKITSAGTFTSLLSFGGTNTGGESFAPLILATDGDFYGTSYYGTIFQMTAAGAITTLHGFSGADGQNPEGGLAEHTNGTFYGVTNRGGSRNYGVVYSLNTGLGAFVKTLPTSGKVGAKIGILGTGLTGTTDVTFNGTPATFTVGSNTFIAATVPTSATTGPVQVVTPSGTLTSNVNFRVLP